MFRDTHHGKPCRYCLRLMDRKSYALQATRDHVMPICRGGGPKVVCCITCNGIKGDMLPDVWEAFMEAHPRWWTLSRLELRRIQRAARGLPTLRQKARRLRVRQGSPRTPVVVPKELIYGHREKGNTDPRAAMVEASAQVRETPVLET